MRIPKFLIKFHSRVKDTWAWRQRRKIIVIAPFVIGLGVFVYYTGYRMHAEKNHAEFVATWEAKGESLDVDVLIPDVRDFDQEDDFFSHPAIVAELSHPVHTQLARLPHAGIAGLSTDGDDYFNPHGHGAYVTGHKNDVTMWLDPKVAGISEQQAAEKILDLMAPIFPRLDAIVDASHRKNAWFERDFNNDGMPKANRSMSKFKLWKIPIVLGERSIIYLLAGDEQKARTDYLAAIRVAKHYRRDNNLIGQFVGIASTSSLERSLWEGLTRRLWSEESLVEFENLLKDINEEERFFKTLRQEVASIHFMVHRIHESPSIIEQQSKTVSSLAGPSKNGWKEMAQEALIKMRPRGWYLKHGIETLEILDEVIFYPNGSKATSLSMDMAKTLDETPYPLDEGRSNVFSDDVITMSFYSSLIIKTLRAQATLHLMRTAIALERYRLQHSAYPKSLAQLVPAYLPRVLEDPVTRAPINYRIKADGTPLLYTVGANETDEGGLPNLDPDNGDWTWMYSPPAGFSWSDYKKR